MKKIEKLVYREIVDKLKSLENSTSCITLEGPRYSGKTTVCQMAFPKLAYVDLEALDIRAQAEADPRSFLEQYNDNVILDEIQNIPALLSYVKERIDKAEKENTKVMYVLTGSYQPGLRQELSQSLAGRTITLNLLPFSLNELAKAGIKNDADEVLVQGLYPRAYKPNTLIEDIYRSYLNTYVERDISKLINIKDKSKFHLFLVLCAGRIGQLLNKNALASDVGVSSETIEHWLSILEASFVIIRLQPYHNNLVKRNTKSPKLYFTDTGLAAFLLEIGSAKQMVRDPLKGSLFENLVFLELLKAKYNSAKNYSIYFYRDSKNNEIDFVVKQGRDLIAVEVKSAKTVVNEFFKGIKHFNKIFGPQVIKSYLIYSGENINDINNTSVINFNDTIGIHQLLLESSNR